MLTLHYQDFRSSIDSLPYLLARDPRGSGFTVEPPGSQNPKSIDDRH
jgi:hypothetical protein